MVYLANDTSFWKLRKFLRLKRANKFSCYSESASMVRFVRICFSFYPPSKSWISVPQPYGIQSHSIRVAHWFELAPQVGHIIKRRSGTAWHVNLQFTVSSSATTFQNIFLFINLQGFVYTSQFAFVTFYPVKLSLFLRSSFHSLRIF